MGVLGSLRLSFWLVVIGTVVLYAFFVILATIPPGEVAAVTTVVVALGVFVVALVALGVGLVRRTDPEGREFGRFVHEEIWQAGRPDE